MTATHVLHARGCRVGMEVGLKPIPVECPDRRPAQIDKLTAVIVETVRRCAPLAGDPRVDWQAPLRCHVWVQTDMGRLEIAVFYIEDIRPFGPEDRW